MKRKLSEEESQSPSSKSPRSLTSPLSAKRLNKRRRRNSSSQKTLDFFSFSIKGKIETDKKTDIVDKHPSKPLEERFQLKSLSICLDRKEAETKMAEMTALFGRKEGKKRRSKVVLKYDNEGEDEDEGSDDEDRKEAKTKMAEMTALFGRKEEKKRRSKVVLKYDNGGEDEDECSDDEDRDDADLSDKENAPIAKTSSKSKLTVKMPFFFGSKSKPKVAGKVKRTTMAAFLEGKSVEKDSAEMDSAEKESEKRVIEGNDEAMATTGEEHLLDENGNIKPKRVKNDGSDSDDSDSDDSDEDDDDIVKRREKNLLDNQRMLRQMMQDFDDKSFIKPASIRRMSLPSSRAAFGEAGERRSRRQSMGIVALHANRKSPPRTRSRGVDGLHAEGLKDDDATLRRRIDYNENLKVYFDEDDEETREAESAIKPEAIRKRVSTKKAIPHVVLPVEKVTASMLANISAFVTEKVYDPLNGSSCHQCRQKTKDTKTSCRSPDCVGVRGQFCGVCLHNRYGENAEDALLDPEWKCPPCRGICNCSICRSRSGRCPTGILFNYSSSLGYKSVHHFLAKKGEGKEDEDEEEGEEENRNRKTKIAKA